MKLFWTIAFFCGVLNAAQAQVKTARLVKARSVITYHMTHPMHDWSGSSKSLDGVLQYEGSNNKLLKLALLVPVASFDSKNSNRDAHMLEVTDALKYPKVSFVSASVEESGNGTVVAKGVLTFHGVSKQVQLTAAKTTKGNLLLFTGKFRLLLSDYKIERPSLMLIKTDDAVDFDFSAEFAL